MLKSHLFFNLKVINSISFSNALASNELQGTPAWETTHPADLAIISIERALGRQPRQC